MSNITKIKIDNERERSYQDFPANREFKKRAEDDNPGGGWPSDLPKPSAGGYGYTTIEEGETVNHKISEEYLPEISSWPSDLPLPTSGGYGYTEPGGEPTTVKTNSGTVGDGEALFIDESDDGETGAPHDWHVGDILTVTINGVTYQVPLRDDGHGSWDAGAARNESSYFDIDWSEYDFLVHVSWDEDWYECTNVTFQHAGTYEVSMTVINETVHKIDEKYLPESGTDPILENAKESGGIGYFEYYTDNSKEACLSMADKSLNTKYLVLDLSEESQTKMDMIRSLIKLSNVNKRTLQLKLKAYLNTTSMGKLESVFNTTNCTAYDASGKNYYENSNNNKFYVILDNSLLEDELQEVFPKNGIYYECFNPEALSLLSEVGCSIRKYYTISQDYIGAPSAIYLSTTGGKVMAIRVANDGTITASEV